MSAETFGYIQNRFPNGTDLKQAIDDEIRRKEAAEAEQRAAARDRERIQIRIRELNTGDNYTAGQVGAMGPQAHAHDMTLRQVNALELGQIDLQNLAGELATLRRAMRLAAVKPEHDISIGQVAAAEIAAQKRDVCSVVRQLTGAGKWAFDVATKTGVSVASEAMKKVMGL